MKYLKLFEEVKIEPSEFPNNGYGLSVREKKILTDLVGENYLHRFAIKVDDNYYYILFLGNFNVFDGFNELKNYVLSWYYIHHNEPEKYLELLMSSDLDPSFDDNQLIWWASKRGHTKIVEALLNDNRIDPSTDDNSSIKLAKAYGRKEIVKLLFNDERVRSKLTQEEVNEYTKYIS